ncbi:hypothetical protein HNP84_003933 [Thermocatellispora tengchongensis]|uniref:Uncharacterized protein n=1 Tax=Thermocatellispora tengchongensis TaxID=1073253 RepID=A0A840PAI1_9ACTN|nr:hypothetical protein [Thermocatellispora tengchongensis]MBB5134207.1 hypothetical protein [Thermocatellispora tengchongensis]
MNTIQRQQRAYQEALLVALRNELAERGVTAAFVIGDDDRPRVEVMDVHLVTRRVYVHLPFMWFYWGDQPDERVSCTDVPRAVARVQEAAAAGWNPGEQGEISFNLHQIAQAYRF